MRVHSAHWLASIVRKAQKTLSPGATIRMMNFGAHDESSLIGILDELAGDSSVGPLVIFTYGLNRDFLDYVLACCPTAVIGVLSTWETLGWPYREVSDLEAIGAVEPVEHFAGRLRSGAHARLDYYIHHRFLDRCPEIIGRVRSDRTTILPSESFYIWVPEFQATSDAEARQQTARMEAMGDLGARTLLVEKLVPGLMTLYPMRADPHSRPAPEPPRPGLAGFHRLVLEGWRRWNLQVPDPFDFEVHWVPKPLGSGSKADMRPSLPALSESHPVMNGAVLQTTEKGVELYWDSRGRLTPPGDATALIVLPRHISEYVGAQPIDLMCFPVPPRTRGKSLRLWLRVDPLGIEWEVAWKKSGSWSGRFESP